MNTAILRTDTCELEIEFDAYVRSEDDADLAFVAARICGQRTILSAEQLDAIAHEDEIHDAIVESWRKYGTGREDLVRARTVWS